MSHRLPIALEALEQGYEMHIVTAVTDCMDKMLELGLVLHPVSLDRQGTGLISNGRTFFEIIRVFVKTETDVIHLGIIKSVLLGGIAVHLACVPCVVTAISGLGFIFVS